MHRYLEPALKEDLCEKMVFLGGPRQVGKTTLALSLLGAESENHPGYLSWDVPSTRTSLIRHELPPEQKLVVLDEIHKYRQWRNLVKGLYDTQKSRRQFLITGSARLDNYWRGGDSLQGRYHYYRLHPLDLCELGAMASEDDVRHLMHYSGFPEPFLRANERHYKRWQKERQTRVIHEDLVSLERSRELGQIALLMQLLPERVGAPLSIASLARDLTVAFETAESWVCILENLYYAYRIKPFGMKTIRAVKKEQKLYLWDWSQCTTEGARFENLVASHLLKYCHYLEDHDGESIELRFLRDTDRREIDFVVVKNGKPLFAVECKAGEKNLSPHIGYFAARTTIPVFYQVHLGRKDVEITAARARILPLQKWLQVLRW